MPVPASALLVLCAAWQGDPPEEPWVPVHPLLRELSAEEAARLRAYAWDDRPLTSTGFAKWPVAFGRVGEDDSEEDDDELAGAVIAPDARLDFGAAGLGADTVLYLSCDGPDAAAQDLAGDHAVLTSDLARCAGRFAGGRELSKPTAQLSMYGGDAPLLGEAWTVELWLRPDTPDARRRVLTLAAGVALDLLPNRRVELRLEDAAGGEPLVLTSRVPLTAGNADGDADGWSHVAIAYATHVLPQVRLVVNGDGVGRLDPPRLAEVEAGAADELVLGSPARGTAGFTGAFDDLCVLRRSAATAELLERHAAGATTGEHRLRLVFADGERTERLWSGELRARALDAESARTHGVLEHVVPTEGGGLRWAEGHWERADAPAPPIARTTHPTVFVGGHRVFVLGGETRDTHVGPMRNTSDTWIFDMERRTWREVETDVAPPPTCHQAAAYSPDHDLVLYPGGFRLDEKPWVAYDGTWVFHVAEGSWEERHPGGVPLPALNGCTVVYHPRLRRFVVMVGDEVFVYDPEADRWDRLGAPRVVLDRGRIPPGSVGFPGSSLMAAYEPYTGGIVLFGGEAWIDGEHLFQSTTAVYYVESNTLWIREPDGAPAPRVRAGFARDERRGRFVMFGGVLGQHSKRMNDLWTYRLETDAWRRLDASNTPSPRGGYYDMAYDPELDRFALLCGRNATNRFLDEAWLLQLDPAAAGRATFVLDREGAAAGGRLFAAWRAPGSGEVALRFQASPDGRTWSAWTGEPATHGSAARHLKVEVSLRPGAEAGAEPPELLRLVLLEPGEAAPSDLPEDARRALFELP